VSPAKRPEEGVASAPPPRHPQAPLSLQRGTQHGSIMSRDGCGRSVGSHSAVITVAAAAPSAPRCSRSLTISAAGAWAREVCDDVRARHRRQSHFSPSSGPWVRRPSRRGRGGLASSWVKEDEHSLALPYFLALVAEIVTKTPEKARGARLMSALPRRDYDRELAVKTGGTPRGQEPRAGIRYKRRGRTRRFSITTKAGVYITLTFFLS
jgi:hypothetical protein